MSTWISRIVCLRRASAPTVSGSSPSTSTRRRHATSTRSRNSKACLAYLLSCKLKTLIGSSAESDFKRSPLLCSLAKLPLARLFTTATGTPSYVPRATGPAERTRSRASCPRSTEPTMSSRSGVDRGATGFAPRSDRRSGAGLVRQRSLTPACVCLQQRPGLRARSADRTVRATPCRVRLPTASARGMHSAHETAHTGPRPPQPRAPHPVSPIDGKGKGHGAVASGRPCLPRGRADRRPGRIGRALVGDHACAVGGPGDAGRASAPTSRGPI